MKNFKEAGKLIDKALKSGGDQYYPFLIKGIMLARMGSGEAAYTYFQKAARTDPARGEAYYNMALIDLENGHRARAEYLLIKSMDLDLYNPMPYLVLGRIYREERRIEDSLDMLGKARRINPGSALIHLETGVTFLAAGQVNSAVSSLEKSVLIEPEWAAARNALGAAYRASGQFDKARMNT